MSIVMTLVCVILSLGWGGTGMAQDLPPEIVLDQYLLEGTEALDEGKPDRARRAFEKIEALKVEPPPAFLFTYGQLLVEQGKTEAEVRKGTGLLKRFIVKEAKWSERYTATLKLLSRAAGEIERLGCQEDAYCRAEAERRRAERQRTEAERQRTEAERQRAEAERQRQALIRDGLRVVPIPGGSFKMCCIREQRDCHDDRCTRCRCRCGLFRSDSMR